MSNPSPWAVLILFIRLMINCRYDLSIASFLARSCRRISSSEGGTVISGTEEGEVHALDGAGNLLWSQSVGAAVTRLAELPGSPHYSTVRTQLRVLEEKGFVRHEERGPRYVYFPMTPRDKARRSALRHLVDTFFGGSAEQVVATLLDSSVAKVTDDELMRLSQLIAQARKEGL